MSILLNLAKRVERRALREVENAATKKIKETFFGEKEVKVDPSSWVKMGRAEVQLQDLIGLGDLQPLDQFEKDSAKAILKEYKYWYSALLTCEQESQRYQFLVQKTEALL